MGLRLSLLVMPKSLQEEIYKCTDEKTFFDSVKDLEKIAYDFCTDAMFDIVQEMHRVTETKLSCECDVHLGIMTKEDFKMFTEEVLKYAYRQYENCNDSKDTSWQRLPENKWKLTYSFDWISAYFNCLYIMKVFDWENNVIYFEIS